MALSGKNPNDPRVIRLDREMKATHEPREAVPTFIRKPEAAPKSPMRATPGKKALMLYAALGALAFIVLIALATYFGGGASDPEAETRTLVASVGEHMVLPKDEVPTIATVSDPKALQDQAFFANAIVGDKVIMYLKARKAILYRPSEDKVIEVAPITGGE